MLSGEAGCRSCFFYGSKQKVHVNGHPAAGTLQGSDCSAMSIGIQKGSFPWGVLLVLSMSVMVFIFLAGSGMGMPSVDDWIYAWPVRSVVSGAGWEVPITSNPLAWPQVGLAMVLSWVVGGFSYTILQSIGIFSALASTGLLYMMLIRRGTQQHVAVLLSLCWQWCPLVLFLSGTFMTDIPFLFFSLATISMFDHFLEKRQMRFLVLAVLAGLAASSTRQLGFALFLGMGFVLFQRRQVFGGLWGWWLLANLLFFLVIGWMIAQLNASGIPYARNSIHVLERIRTSTPGFTVSMIKRTGMSAIYLGLMLLPALPLVGARMKRRKWVVPGTVISGVLGWVFFQTLPLDTFGPDRGNIFYLLGLGPLTLPDVFIAHLDHVVVPGRMANVLLALGGCWSFMLLLLTLYPALVTDRKGGRTEVVILWIYLGLVFLAGTYFDRYLLLPFVLVLLLLGPRVQPKQLPMRVSGVLVGLFGILAALAVCDYRSWQGVAWNLYRQAQEQGIDPMQMDAGYEINGWEGNLVRQAGMEASDVFGVGDRDYRITFGHMPGYVPIMSAPYRHILPSRTDSLYVLKRLAP